MVIRGQISNGVVQIDGQLPLPDGTRVLIVPDEGAADKAGPSLGGGHRVKLPLAPSENPGSVPLDSARIAEALDDCDSP